MRIDSLKLKGSKHFCRLLQLRTCMTLLTVVGKDGEYGDVHCITTDARQTILKNSGSDTNDSTGNKDIKHIKVFYKKGEFGGWPANHGIWIWGNEILVGFVRAKHKEQKGHKYDQETDRDFYARSLEGGMKMGRASCRERGSQYV